VEGHRKTPQNKGAVSLFLFLKARPRPTSFVFPQCAQILGVRGNPFSFNPAAPAAMIELHVWTSMSNGALGAGAVFSSAKEKRRQAGASRGKACVLSV